MKNKIISAALAVVLAFSVALTFSGCGDENYPVQVANISIEKEPENVVVLDPAAADIISYIGYETKLVGRSDQVTQEWLSAAPSFGSANSPDLAQLKAVNPNIVFAPEYFDSSLKKQLNDDGIKVITMSQAKTQKQLETNYLTLGKILGGNVKGSGEGAEAYEKLLEKMERTKQKVNSQANGNVLYTVCYLYMENNSLKLMTSGTYGDMLLSYTGAVNAAVNIDEDRVDVGTLKVANPNFIFYADEATLNAVKKDTVLGQLTAVKKKKTLMITQEEMSRQGKTALDTLDKMVGFMYPALAKEETSATVSPSVPVNNATTSAEPTTAPDNSVPATEPEKTSQSVASAYKIKLKGLSLKYEDDNNNVKIMQKRLFDLGYITDEENITGYYGDISKQAVEDFQKNNNLPANGTANNKTLIAMFQKSAVKA